MYQPSMYHGTSELVSLLLVYVCTYNLGVFKVHILCGVLLGPYVSGREGGRDLGGREGGREGGEGRGGEGRLFSLQNWL